MKWMAKDATELELPAASFDVVFSNWLLMYLSDAEVTKLAADALCWVRAQPCSPCRHAIRNQIHLSRSSSNSLGRPALCVLTDLRRAFWCSLPLSMLGM